MTRRGTTETPLKARGAQAVMASRREPMDSLEFFPTPPHSTRALMEHVLKDEPLHVQSCWEPACGRGHMSEVLAERFETVHATDVFDYGCGYGTGSFVGVGPDVAACPFQPDWIITNPPFSLAEEFVSRGLREARRGVAIFIRSQWLETHGRYEELFSKIPPSIVALFVERVALVKGRWDPDASTATAYCWVVWRKPFLGGRGTELLWIPPGCKEKLTHRDDRRRFAPETVDDGGLFAEVAE